MQTFVGFGTLEELAKEMIIGVPVNVESCDEGRPGTMGLTYHTCSIVTSQVQEDGSVMYHRLVTGSYQTMMGDPVPGHDLDALQARMDSAWAGVVIILKAAGFRTRRALVSAPKDTQFMEGQVLGLRYNKDTDLFEIIPQEPDADAAYPESLK
jgi:hypothetical protein